MIRTKGEAGTGNIIEAVRHVRSVMGDIRVLRNMDDDEVFSFAKKISAPYDLVMQTKQLGRLPVVEGAAMIRTKGEAGTGNIIEAVRHVRSVMGDIRVLRNMDDDEVFSFAKKISAPYDLVMQTKQLGRLPVVARGRR